MRYSGWLLLWRECQWFCQRAPAAMAQMRPIHTVTLNFSSSRFGCRSLAPRERRGSNSARYRRMSCLGWVPRESNQPSSSNQKRSSSSGSHIRSRCRCPSHELRYAVWFHKWQRRGDRQSSQAVGARHSMFHSDPRGGYLCSNRCGHHYREQR
jgi:hypothetical protein